MSPRCDEESTLNQSTIAFVFELMKGLGLARLLDDVHLHKRRTHTIVPYWRVVLSK